MWSYGNMDKLKKYFGVAQKKVRTQADIARELGVHRSLVNHWIMGRRKPSRKLLKPLSRLTGIKIEDLL